MISTKEGGDRVFFPVRRPSSSREAVKASITRCLFRFFSTEMQGQLLPCDQTTRVAGDPLKNEEVLVW